MSTESSSAERSTEGRGRQRGGGDAPTGHKSGDSQIVRRKYTMPKWIANLIDYLADAHYSDNSSQCVRAAIMDHQGTLRGDGEERLRGIGVDLKHLRKDVDEFEEILEEIVSALNAHTRGGVRAETVAGTGDGTPAHSQMSAEMDAVHEKIADAHPDGLSADEIHASLEEFSKADVQHALIDLQEREKVATASDLDGTTRYVLTSDANTNARD